MAALPGQFIPQDVRFDLVPGEMHIPICRCEAALDGHAWKPSLDEDVERYLCRLVLRPCFSRALAGQGAVRPERNHLAPACRVGGRGRGRPYFGIFEAPDGSRQHDAFHKPLMPALRCWRVLEHRLPNASGYIADCPACQSPRREPGSTDSKASEFRARSDA